MTFSRRARIGHQNIAGDFSLSSQSLLAEHRMVWAHAIFNGLPNYSYETLSSGSRLYYYNETYPLDLVPGDWSYWNSNKRNTEGVPRALEAGLNGLQILQIASNTSRGTDFLEDWWASADARWSTTNPVNNFVIAPCLEIDQIGNASGANPNATRISTAVRHITQYLAAAPSHLSSAKIREKYVIYFYNIGAFDASKGRSMMSPSDWASVRAQVDAAGYAGKYFLVGHLETSASQFGWTFGLKSTLVSYLPYFDAWYTFEERMDLIWNEVVDFVNQHHLLYAGGIMPGYDRENVGSAGGFTDAEGTRRYRRSFELTDGSGMSWNNMITWSDFVEHSEMMATSDWNKTRADITAFYSARLRGVAYPRPQAELYITTPKAIFPGDSFGAEAMVLNASADAVTVYVQLFDSSGAIVGSTASQVISGHTTGDATVTLAATSAQANAWFRAQATTYSSTGALLQQVMSAPICVYATGTIPTTMLRRLYYSIPAYAALVNPTLSIPNNPTSGATNATVTAPGGVSVRFSEVLQNTRQVFNGYNANPYTVSVPMGSRSGTNGTVTSTPNGFYVGRVIDEQERVGYSDPLFFS